MWYWVQKKHATDHSWSIDKITNNAEAALDPERIAVLIDRGYYVQVDVTDDGYTLDDECILEHYIFRTQRDVRKLVKGK